MRSTRAPIRFAFAIPSGMSWLVGGTLRLSGNAQAATLSGRIVVDRLLMAEGFDLGELHGFRQGAGERAEHDLLVSAKSAIRHSGGIQPRFAHGVDRRAAADGREPALARHLGASHSARPHSLAERGNEFSRQPVHHLARRHQFRQSLPPGSGAERRGHDHDPPV